MLAPVCSTAGVRFVTFVPKGRVTAMVVAVMVVAEYVVPLIEKLKAVIFLEELWATFTVLL